MISSRLQALPTTRARFSRETGSAEAKIAASTRPIHSRQRAGAGRSSSSRSRSPRGFRRPRHRSEPVEPERRASGQFADRAERDQPVEQPPRPALRHLPAEFRGRAEGVVVEQRLQRGPCPLGAQFRLRRPAAFAPAARAPPTGRTPAPPPWRRRTRWLPRRRRRRRPPRAGRRPRTAARRARAARTAISAAAPARRRRARPRAARPPLPGRQATGARRSASGRAARGRRRAPRRTAPAGRRRRTASAASIASCRASSCGTPKTSAAAANEDRHCPAERADEFPPGEQMLSRRPGIGARPGEMEGVAQSRLVLGPAGARNAGGGGAQAPGAGGKRRPRAGFRERPRRGGKAPRRRERRLRPRFPGAIAAAPRRGTPPAEAVGRLWSRQRISAVEHAARLADGGAFA